MGSIAAKADVGRAGVIMGSFGNSERPGAIGCGNNISPSAQVSVWERVVVFRAVKTVPEPCPFRTLFVPFSCLFRAGIALRPFLAVDRFRSWAASRHLSSVVSLGIARHTRAVSLYPSPRAARVATDGATGLGGVAVFGRRSGKRTWIFCAKRSAGAALSASRCDRDLP